MGKMILVVDDEEDILYILKNVLTKEGYKVKEAKSGEECLEMLDKERPDLIFMDIMMPGINGWDVARQIKTEASTKHIPISIVSVKCDKEDKKKSMDYSYADRHLCKPVNFDALLDTAEALLTPNN
jgi:CheY-like chemotaxis protein